MIFLGHPQKKRLYLALAAIAGIGSAPAVLAEISLSGFGTLGYARSDQSFAYQRFINDGGTFKRDSVFGAQLDAKLSPQFGLTVQARVMPSLNSDKGWEATIPWAFLSWRPSNDWLLRFGRYRVPSYLNAENIDVGQTFDYLRLPYEVYSTTPSADFNGLSFNKTWDAGNNEFSLDGYWGKAGRTAWRFHNRDSVPSIQESGPYYWPIKLTSTGLSLGLQRNENVYRIGAYKATALPEKPFPVSFPFVSLAPGMSYYQTTDLLPGPGVPGTNKLDISVYYLAADIGLGYDIRLAGEYVRRAVKKTNLGPDSQSGFVSLRKRIGRWTPYAIHARIHSQAGPLDAYQALSNSVFPANIPGASLVNLSQRAGADGVIAYDQYANSLGVAYALTSTSKIKADWTRVHIGTTSSMVDAPALGDVRQKNINILSLSYSFVF